MTSTKADFLDLGVSPSVLGRPFGKWRIDSLKTVLQHYGINELQDAKKIDLILALDLIAPYYRLSPKDGILFKAHQARRIGDLPKLRRPSLKISLHHLLNGKYPSKIRYVDAV